MDSNSRPLSGEDGVIFGGRKGGDKGQDFGSPWRGCRGCRANTTNRTFGGSYSVPCPPLSQSYDASEGHIKRFARMYGTNTEPATTPSVVHRADIRNDCSYEVEKYLLFTEDMTGGELCLATWWEENSHMFPRTTKLARKWFGCVATSVPCERAFSTAGHVVSARPPS